MANDCDVVEDQAFNDFVGHSIFKKKEYYESQVTNDEYERLKELWDQLNEDLKTRMELCNLGDTQKEDKILSDLKKINVRLDNGRMHN